MAKLYPSIEIINKRKPMPTEGEMALVDFLCSNYNDEYEIFYQPFLNGDLPDVILMHKGDGVMIFEVKDWDLSNYTILSDGKWKVNANGAILNNTPLKQVLKYKENLYNLHIDSLLSLKLKDYKYWYVASCAIYFHCHSTDEAYKKCLGSNPTPKYKTFLNKNLSILGHDFLSKSKMDRVFDQKWISRRSRYFTDDLYDSFSRILHPSFHTIEQGMPINLTKEQLALSKSVGGARKRIKGVAGSGKTLVLAQRAVNAHKRTKGLVLILTYNITLRNYIHDKISAVREEFDWNYFHISNYHEFITSNMNNVGLEFDFLATNENGKRLFFNDEDDFTKLADINVYSNLHLFDGHKDELPKYDVILIDETQDYKENWIRIIKKYFATEDAEFVVFADEKQNIYSRELDEEKMPIIPIQVGPWDRKLNISYRLSKKIALLVSEFQKYFFSTKYVIDEKIESDATLDLYDPYIEYHLYKSLDTNNEDSHIAKYIYGQILEHKLNSNDVTVLSSRIAMLRYLDKMLRIESKEKTNIMFETQEEYDKISQSYYSFEEQKNEVNKIRKNRKANFWMNRGTIKLSTIHSFKGWESPALFLVVENTINASKQLKNQKQPIPFSDELVYTGVTRCQNYLFIININNPIYDEFFSKSRFVDKIIKPKEIL